MVTAGQAVVLGLFVVAAVTMAVISVRKARRSTASEPADPVRMQRRRLAALVVVAAGLWLLFRESDDAKAARLTQERAVTSLMVFSCQQQGGDCGKERARARKVQAEYDEFFGSRP